VLTCASDRLCHGVTKMTFPSARPQENLGGLGSYLFDFRVNAVLNVVIAKRCTRGWPRRVRLTTFRPFCDTQIDHFRHDRTRFLLRSGIGAAPKCDAGFYVQPRGSYPGSLPTRVPAEFQAIQRRTSSKVHHIRSKPLPRSRADRYFGPDEGLDFDGSPG
jgi:hypothetical protein